MVQPVGGSLGVVPESFPMVQRDYNWPPMMNGPLPPAPPPHHPPPPPPHPHGHPPNPSYVPPNHIEWAGGGGGNFSEQERVRSQSWAGLVCEYCTCTLYKMEYWPEIDITKNENVDWYSSTKLDDFFKFPLLHLCTMAWLQKVKSVICNTCICRNCQGPIVHLVQLLLDGIIAKF